MILIIGILGYVFTVEKYVMIILMILGIYNLIVVRDLLPIFALLLIIGMVPLGRHGEEGYFTPEMYYMVPFIAAAFIAHFIIYPPKVKSKKFLLPTAAVALAVTFGGLFSPTFINTFKMPALYYVISLGFGMVALYLMFEGYIEHGDKNLKIYFSKIMVILGLIGTAMIFTNYIRYIDLLKSNLNAFQSHFQFGNNISSNLLISLPFAFYLAVKSKYGAIYFIAGILQFFAMVFSLSRGGIISAVFIIPFVIAATLIFAKENRIKYICILIASFAIIVTLIMLFAYDLLGRIIENINVSGDEARVNLYKQAWENFLQYPVFGTGLGYYGDPAYYRPEAWCIYWYHSTLFQILGSLGVLGIICYGYQYFIRFKTIFKAKRLFNIFVLLSFVGFECYQLVNVGNFAPFPYVLGMIIIFIVLDRNNEMEDETIKIRKQLTADN
jgi:hypothetical protein